MSWAARAVSLYRRWMHREQVEEDLDREVQAYFEILVERYMARGLSREEARRTARVEFEGPEEVKQKVREARMGTAVETALRDISCACRVLRKSPGFTVIGALTLALGIGANTAIFSVVDAVLLKPLPYPNPDRLVIVRQRVRLPGYEGDRDMVTPADFHEWRLRSTSFEDISAIRYRSFDVTGDGEPLRVEGEAVSANLFTVLEANAWLGRVFRPEEDRYGGPRVVLLSYALWASRFGKNPNILGRIMRLDGENYTIVGVMPRWFRFFDPDDRLWVPLDLKPQELANRTDQSLIAIARLKPAVDIVRAQAEMDAVSAQLAEQYPETNRGMTAHVILLRERLIGNVRAAVLILWSCSGFVLLIVCANVANLMLTRCTMRRQEFAIRAALGAGGTRILRQLLTESLLLALLGGAIGILVAVWVLHAIRWISPPDSFPYLPRLDEMGVDATVLVFNLGISVFAGIVFGMIPALQARSCNLRESLQENTRGSTGGPHSWVRAGLIVTETAIGTLVLAGAGLLLRSYLHIERVPLGFEPNHVLTMRIIPRGAKYATEDQRTQFYHEILERIESLPGVQSAGATNFLPLTRVREVYGFSVEGQPAPSPGHQPTADFRMVTPGYFQAMSIPLIKGRAFSWSDAPRSMPVAIIGETMARQFWPRQDAIGKRIRAGSPGSPGEWLAVIGIAGDARNFEVVSEPQPTVYLPFAQPQQLPLTLHDEVVRSALAPASLSSAVRNAIWAVDPDLSISRMRTMKEVYDISVTPQRFNLVLIGLMACVGVFLATVGLYGVTAYSVAGRTREIGIRLALGAQRRDVLRLVVLQGVCISLIGIAIGTLAAVVLTTQMSGLLFGMSTADPPTYATVALFLLVVALAACYFPARAATRLDPIAAIRYQ